MSLRWRDAMRTARDRTDEQVRALEEAGSTAAPTVAWVSLHADYDGPLMSFLRRPGGVA